MNTTSANDITRIRILTASASLLLSFIAVYFDDLINADGVLYVNMAEAFLAGGLEETAKLYNWPFFSITISFLHQLTTLPIEISSYLLNGLLFILLNDTLIRISHKILPSKNQLIAAALLFICFLPINEYRDFIIRDIGYWAFSALAFYYFILFTETPTIKTATAWQLAIIVAVLFRVEGILILIGLPLFLFSIQKPKDGLKHILLLNYLFIISLPPLIFITFSSHSAFNKLDSIKDFTSINSFLSILEYNATILKTQILNEYSEDYAGLILVSGLLSMLLFKGLKAFGLGYIMLCLTSLWQKKNKKPNSAPWLLYYFFSLNAIILIVFVLHKYFITTRHTVLALISFLLIMLPTICSFLEKAWSAKARSIIVFAGIILSINLIDSLVQSNSKSHIKNTARWAAENLTQGSTILTDDNLISYYAKTQNTNTNISVGDLKNYQTYDYVIITKKKKNPEGNILFNERNLSPIYNEKNKRGDSISIYKTK